MRASKAIYVERQVFAVFIRRAKPLETPNDVLRRLLGLPKSKIKKGRPFRKT